MASVSLDRERLIAAEEAITGYRARLKLDDGGSTLEARQEWTEYRSRVREVGADIHEHGPAQVAAFLASKEHKGDGKKARSADVELLGQLTKWLTGGTCPVTWPPEASQGTLVRRLIESEPDVWRVAAREAMAFTAWLKLLVDAYPADGRPA